MCRIWYAVSDISPYASRLPHHTYRPDPLTLLYSPPTTLLWTLWLLLAATGGTQFTYLPALNPVTRDGLYRRVLSTANAPWPAPPAPNGYLFCRRNRLAATTPHGLGRTLVCHSPSPTTTRIKPGLRDCYGRPAYAAPPPSVGGLLAIHSCYVTVPLPSHFSSTSCSLPCLLHGSG